MPTSVHVPARRAIVVVDLAFGDCGKGTTVDYLARSNNDPLVVRFNGGPQAAHNVATPDGRHHTFAQFGSGTLAGSPTLLSRFMLLDPYALHNEAEHLLQLGVAAVWDTLRIDRRCRVITPVHQAANRLREIARGARAHGSCGQGVGELMADDAERPEWTLRAADLSRRHHCGEQLHRLARYKREQLMHVTTHLHDDPAAAADLATLTDLRWIDTAVEVYAQLAERVRLLSSIDVNRTLNSAGTLLFEGAQGVLLDEQFGFHPHTTWSTTTAANADLLLREFGFAGNWTRLGVLRSYFTRHGPGPFVTEDHSLRRRLPETHNRSDACQGAFRTGVFDAVAARYSIRANRGVNGVVLTHLDRLPELPPLIATRYADAGVGNREHFQWHGAGMTNLTLPPDTVDPEKQARLTDDLRRCRPVFSGVDTGDPDAFVSTVEQQLQTRVVLQSYGPTRDDKRFDRIQR